MSVRPYTAYIGIPERPREWKRIQNYGTEEAAIDAVKHALTSTLVVFRGKVDGPAGAKIIELRGDTLFHVVDVKDFDPDA